MATDRYVNPYIDSSVFIAWIHKEVILDVDRFKIADHIIKQAESGEYSIYISALTLAEVHKLPRGTTPALTKDQDERIIQFFQNDFFKVLPVDRDIGETANRFCREYGILGNDAIHLACALRARCEVLLVWDRPLGKKVQRGDIRIEEPQILGQMILTTPLTNMDTKGDDKPEEESQQPPEQRTRTEPPLDSAGLRRDVEGVAANTTGAETGKAETKKTDDE